MFIKYPHIERLGNDEVEGILVGTCHIFPKIDGTNASAWIDDEGCVQAGSRRKQLSLEQDNAGFLHWLVGADGSHVASFLFQNSLWTLYGEWLVPHSLKTYRKDAWRKFYVFDVLDRELGSFVHYDDYAPALDAAGIDYIPLLETRTNPTEEHLVQLLDRNTFLIEDGQGVGEGIVIKRYGYTNGYYGRTTWAKVVRNEFKEQNAKAFGAPKTSMLGGIEIELAETYVTEGRIQKTLDKMTEDAPWTSRRIPELFSRVWHDLIADELWGILKKHKNPTVDFRRFYSSCAQQIKALKPELF